MRRLDVLEWIGLAVMAVGLATWPLSGQLWVVLVLMFIGVLIAGFGTTRREQE